MIRIKITLGGGVAPLSVTQPHKQAISSEQATPNPAQLNLQFVISLYDSGASTEQALLHTTLSTISSVVNAINHSDTTACHVSMTICASKAQQYVVTALQQAIKGPISFSVAPKAVANLNQVLQQSTADYICVCRAGDSYPQDFVATVCSSVHALPQDAAQSASAAAESPYPYDILVATAVDTKDRELSPWRDSNVATQRFALLSGLSSCILRGAYLREHQLALPEHDNALYSLFLLRLAQDPAIKIKPLPQARVVINEQAISAAGSNHASDVLPSLQQLNKALKAIPVTTLSPAVRVSLLAALFNDLHRSAMRTPAVKPRLTYCETLLKAYDKLHQQLSTEAITFSMGNLVLHNSAELFDNRIQGNKSLLKALQHHSVDELFGLKAVGLFTEEDFVTGPNGELTLRDDIPAHTFSTVRPGDIRYEDVNNDGVVNAMDEVAMGGTVNPEIVYGFGGNVRWKNLDFSFFFQGNGKTYRFIGGPAANFLPGSSQGTMGNILSNYNDRWTEENPSQDVFYPRLSWGPNANNSQNSSWWYKDMSMLRLKDVEIGYSLPHRWMDKIRLESIRIYLKGSNLATFSSFKLWDPELDTQTGSKYPIMRSVSIGFDINF